MNTTDPRPSPVQQPPDQETGEPPPPTRALPTDRQLPGLGWNDSGHRHYVPAGTLPMPGESQYYRAACGAVCLRMPPPRDGWEYEYQRLPLHPDCQPQEETAMADKKDQPKKPAPEPEKDQPKPQRTEREQREAGGWNWE